MKKNKKKLILAVICGLCFIGGALAFFHRTFTFDNPFTTKPYSTQVTEHFESPKNWTPGTTTDKTITVENTGEVDVAVRVKFEGKWVSANGATLDGKVNGQDVAILNFDTGIAEGSNANWEKKADGYYYYKKTLAPKGTTETLLKSVTFNENTEALNNCTTTDNESQHTSVTKCVSSGDGYDGATYTLKITIETVQADAKDSFWK